jgi:hypothetical protein
LRFEKRRKTRDHFNIWHSGACLTAHRDECREAEVNQSNQRGNYTLRSRVKVPTRVNAEDTNTVSRGVADDQRAKKAQFISRMKST